MGFELAQKVLRNRLPVTPSEKLLLAMVADRIDHKGFCYPSVRRLATESGLSPRHVIRSLKFLSGINVVVITRIAGANSEYKIIEDVLDKMIQENQEPPKNPQGGHKKDKLSKGVTHSQSPLTGKGGDSQSGVGVTVSQGGTDTESGEGCHTVSLIDKEINTPIEKVKKAKPSAIAHAPIINYDLGSGKDKTAMMLMEGKATKLNVNPKYTYTHENLISSFGMMENHQSIEFIYHMIEAVETLKGGQCYNIVTTHIPPSLIKKVEWYLHKEGFKVGFSEQQHHAQDAYIKIYKPYNDPPLKYETPLMAMSDVPLTAFENLSKSLSKSGDSIKNAFNVPVQMMNSGDLTFPESAMKELLSVSEQFQKSLDMNPTDPTENPVNVDQIKNMVTKGQTNLKPAKATPITSWRDAVLAWRTENEVTGSQLSHTQKDAGMLNKVKKKYGAGFEIAMVHAVLHWKAYVTYANLNTGGKSKPLQPSISYFVLNIDNVKLFLNKKSDTKVKLKIPKKLKITKKVMKDSKTQQLLALAAAKEKKDGA
jgi:hypothetical protein